MGFFAIQFSSEKYLKINTITSVLLSDQRKSGTEVLVASLSLGEEIQNASIATMSFCMSAFLCFYLAFQK